VRDVPTSPHFRSALRGSIPALLATPFLRQGTRMNDSPIVTAAPAKQLVAKDDEGLIAYTNTLRLSVKAKVAAEQGRGRSLSEIVVQVREMVRVAEEDARHPQRFPSRAFRAISRQAVAWCIESYRPLAFAAGTNVAPRPGDASRPGAPAQLPILPALDRDAKHRDRFHTKSPT
jgi:hypothetical protein